MSTSKSNRVIYTKRCCVPGCEWKSRGRSLNRLPIHSTLWPTWKRIFPFLDKIDVNNLMGARICSLHFCPGDLDESGRLKLNSVPTVNLPAKALRGCNINFISSSDAVVATGCWAKEDKPVPIRLCYPRKCVLCGQVEDGTDRVILTNFPLDVKICRAWLKFVGIEELAGIPIMRLHRTKFLCNSHFRPGCFQGSQLLPNKIPTLNEENSPLDDDILQKVVNSPLDDDILQKVVRRDMYKEKKDDLPKSPLRETTQNIKPIDMNLSGKLENIVQNNIELDKIVKENKNNVFDKNDEVHTLFLSYAGTFRKLHRRFQTMLKLDLAKIFARYELKNAAYVETLKKQPFQSPKIQPKLTKAQYSKKMVKNPTPKHVPKVSNVITKRVSTSFKTPLKYRTQAPNPISSPNLDPKPPILDSAPRPLRLKAVKLLDVPMKFLKKVKPLPALLRKEETDPLAFSVPETVSVMKEIAPRIYSVRKAATEPRVKIVQNTQPDVQSVGTAADVVHVTEINTPVVLSKDPAKG